MSNATPIEIEPPFELPPVDWWLAEGVAAPTICNVDRETGEYLSVGVADFSPLEPGVWLIPAHAYQCEPPVLEAGFATIRTEDGVGWQQVADHRGVMVYSTVTTGEAVVWRALGELPPEWTLEAPGSEFDEWVEDEWVLDEAAQVAALTQIAARKKVLLGLYSTNLISTLQHAVDLEMATAVEVESLNAWKVYSVYLNRVEPSAELMPGDWPSSPNDTAVAAWLEAQGFEEPPPPAEPTPA
jgi:hypothetical protein